MPIMKILVCFSAAALFAGQMTALAGEAPKRPVMAKDSIEMTVLADPEPFQPTLGGAAFKYSPDGEHFLFVTRRGDIENNTNIYELYVLPVSDTKRYVNGETDRPTPTRLARFASNSNRPGIAKAAWMRDSRTIAFLGENPDEPAQVYTVDRRSKRMRRRTDHPAPIRDFAYDLDSGALVFSATVPSRWTPDEENGVVVGVQPFWDVMLKRYGLGTYEQIALYTQRPGGALARVDGLDPMPYLGTTLGFSIAPGGRWAAAVVRVEDAPKSWWTDYAPVKAIPLFSAAKSPENRRFAKGHPLVFVQFVLIDLATGETRPAVDAPTGLFFGGQHLKSYWLDQDTVVLANTFLSLADAPPDQRQARGNQPFVIEVNAATGDYAVIDAIVGSLLDSRITTGGDLVLKSVTPQGPAEKSFVRANGRWDVAQQATERQTEGVVLTVQQSLDVFPEIYATDPGTQNKKALTAFGDQFDHVELGRVETYTWRSGGKEITGGLIKPLNFVDGKRYPLVIQTHGYDPSKFLMDGPYNATAGYAARTLAAEGIMVLQASNAGGRQIGSSPAELEANVAAYQAVVDALDADGLIDTDKVGLHGWSRSGFYVQHALTFSDMKIAAASVADPSSLGMFSNALFFGLGYPAMLGHERLTGGSLANAETAASWIENDPVLNVHRVDAPLRIEQYGSSFGAWWDTYALLRRHGKPAEYVYFPYGFHNLIKPKERLNSKTGYVDWYRFWLLGDADVHHARNDEFVRWRSRAAGSP